MVRLFQTLRYSYYRCGTNPGCVNMGPRNAVNQRFPVHKKLEVIDGSTIYKNNNWWKAVVLVDGFRGQEVALYLWKRKGDDWKRQQKYVVRSEDDWEREQEAIETHLEKMSN